MIQFLVEALVLSVLGGALGAGLAMIAIVFLRDALEIPMTLSLPALTAGLVVSMGIGIVFGLLPARKAARLDPIDALRGE